MQNVHAHIVGEHGDSSVPMWSSASIGGIPLVQYARANNVKLTDDDLEKIHKQVEPPPIRDELLWTLQFLTW